MDEWFASIADSVQGFGGAFYDSTGALTINAQTGTALGPAQRQRLIALLRRANGGRELRGENGLRVRNATYDFRVLLDAYRGKVIPQIPLIEGVTTSDIDEVANQIVVTVSAPELVAPAEKRFRGLGIPEKLVRVGVQAPVQTQASLADSLRPVPGGAKIMWNSAGYCTLGYNLVRYVDDTIATARYFVTNAHCTSTRNALDYTQIRQFGHYIGSEIGDPAAFTNAYTTACPISYQCRWSDAALFQYDSPSQSDHGRVAFPTLNSLNFSAYMTITTVSMPFVGYTVNMIGSATGRRSGAVTSACIDVWGIAGWPAGRLLCQGRANYSSGLGDSGAPVIEAFGDWTAWATGLHWGSNTDGSQWFSSMQSVLAEFYDRLPGNPSLSPVTY